MMSLMSYRLHWDFPLNPPAPRHALVPTNHTGTLPYIGPGHVQI